MGSSTDHSSAHPAAEPPVAPALAERPQAATSAGERVWQWPTGDQLPTLTAAEAAAIDADDRDFAVLGQPA